MKKRRRIPYVSAALLLHSSAFVEDLRLDTKLGVKPSETCKFRLAFVMDIDPRGDCDMVLGLALK
jgi:hypothetical protein